MCKSRALEQLKSRCKEMSASWDHAFNQRPSGKACLFTNRQWWRRVSYVYISRKRFSASPHFLLPFNLDIKTRCRNQYSHIVRPFYIQSPAEALYLLLSLITELVYFWLLLSNLVCVKIVLLVAKWSGYCDSNLCSIICSIWQAIYYCESLK